jgi:hypothetical protein
MDLTRAQRQSDRQTIAIDYRMDLLVKPPRDLPIDWCWFLLIQAPC